MRSSTSQYSSCRERSTRTPSVPVLADHRPKARRERGGRRRAVGEPWFHHVLQRAGIERVGAQREQALLKAPAVHGPRLERGGVDVRR